MPLGTPADFLAHPELLIDTWWVYTNVHLDVSPVVQVCDVREGHALIVTVVGPNLQHWRIPLIAFTQDYSAFTYLGLAREVAWTAARSGVYARPIEWNPDSYLCLLEGLNSEGRIQLGYSHPSGLGGGFYVGIVAFLTDYRRATGEEVSVWRELVAEGERERARAAIGSAAPPNPNPMPPGSVVVAHYPAEMTQATEGQSSPGPSSWERVGRDADWEKG